MSLIDILFYYAGLVHDHNRNKANKWLKDICDADMHQHIIASVGDDGRFIDADGMTMHLNVSDVSEFFVKGSSNPKIINS